MKSNSAAVSKPSTLEKQRALVRVLIEQNGWAPPVTRSPAGQRDKEIPDNVIPFPLPGKLPGVS
jgi:hypothetical protein